jgi:hypothetical protein
MGPEGRVILPRMLARMPRKWLYLLMAASFLAVVLYAIFGPTSFERRIRRIQREVAELRGLEFKHPIASRKLSAAEAHAFIEGEVAKTPKIPDYWGVVRMLGVYRGPDLEPPEKIFAELSSLAAGAYDAYTDTFFQFDDMGEEEQRMVIAHELYHGLQDQHFDLKEYLVERSRRSGVNNDQILARTAVVEGDASYLDAIYLAYSSFDTVMTHEQLASVIEAQAGWTPDQWEETLRDESLSDNDRARVQRAIDTRKRVPRYMLEVFLDSYVDGMTFIHVLHEKGWPEVEKAYREHPPESMEQILHPEKWFAREPPVSIDWPEFSSDPLFADWELLDENVLGERLWRQVFREQGFDSDARSVAAGWGGDRYAVFKHRYDDTYLMLTYTTWDTAEDAVEFSTAYQRVLETKARGAQASVFALGNEVLIVECPVNAPAGAFMEFNRRAVMTGR